MAKTVQQIVLEVSTQLNDQEPGFQYTRWTVVELINYLNLGLIEIGNFRPDAFTGSQQVTLVSGAIQQVPAGVTLLKSVDYNGSTSLCPFSPIVQCDLNLMRAFFKQPCLPTGGASSYRVRTYAYDAKNPGTFYVSPPVPAGNTTTVIITAVNEAPQYDNTMLATPIAVDQKYITAAEYFMLMKAYEVDTESQTSAAENSKYRQMFYNMMGVNYKQSTGYNSGQFLGQGGDKQMTKERVT
jgi:hypothetical protein